MDGELLTDIPVFLHWHSHELREFQFIGLLNDQEQHHGRRGSSGVLGPRTEQFALGSLYYLINYGFEVYGDRSLTEDPKEHGRKVVDLLQNMEFPNLDGDSFIDDVIIKCWHNKYITIAELAVHTETFFLGGNNSKDTAAEEILTPQLRTVISGFIRKLWKYFRYWWAIVLCRTRETSKPEIASSGNLGGYSYDGIGEHISAEEFSLKKTFCRDLEERGLLSMLSSGEPEELGFKIEWYRHSIS
ncbi:hypothetical protein N7462_003924 [Penicillium macrosclerotiorum]|uniref:uncharacterized protein n=1 Tax=Penicillium macrosclerotiorum TaxID=303699 RepID=UPI0025488927|nr:uncharacterized protein N7462_003924 [Penicillium macrosclerotiorum]KAJ5689532.1 hypothetical protein N7462_003924 [Penicillium macrosclerotiorum]